MYDEDPTGIAFRDVTTLALAGFVSLVILMFPHLNPPGAEATGEIDNPGSLVVEATWPQKLDTDVDLWVRAPNDVPVGYSNKNGHVFNLLRDDLGMIADLQIINHEISFSRGMPPGEYTINLHLYSNRSDAQTIPVRVSVAIRTEQAEQTRSVGAWTVDLYKENQEITVIRFQLDEAGHVVSGSMHNLFTPLRGKPS